MSRPDITLELDSDTARVGEEVTGRVRVVPPGLSPGEVLAVELLWQTSGLSESEEKVVARQELSRVESGGATFRLRVPEGGPMTYAGRSFCITWCVRVPGTPAVETPLSVVAAVRKPQTP